MAQLAERPAVYRLPLPVFWATIFLALLLERTLPLVLPLARLFDFPVLATIYLALLRRHKVYGSVVGAGLGLAQDALSNGKLGLLGIADTLVGYLAAWASGQFDLEQYVPRLSVTAVLIVLHSLIVALLQHALLEAPHPLQPLEMASAVLVNVALASILFQVLDRFRRPA
jgi:rod shape-determining protein MreD